MWALLKSPLILGNDLTRMVSEDIHLEESRSHVSSLAQSLDTFSIIANKEIIAINQDDLGLPARRLSKVVNREDKGTFQVWLGPLSMG